MTLQTIYEFMKFNFYLKHNWMSFVTLINLSEFSYLVDKLIKNCEKFGLKIMICLKTKN